MRLLITFRTHSSSLLAFKISGRRTFLIPMKRPVPIVRCLALTAAIPLLPIQKGSRCTNAISAFQCRRLERHQAVPSTLVIPLKACASTRNISPVADRPLNNKINGMLSIGQRNALHRPSESIPFVVLKRSVFSEKGLKKRFIHYFSKRTATSS